MNKKITVFLVEDDLDFVYLVQKIITRNEMLDFTAYAENKHDGIEMAKKIQPDIVLMDLNLSSNELDGIEAAKEIKLVTNAKILLLTSNEKSEVLINASKRSFASGYIYKRHYQTLTDNIINTAQSATPHEQYIKELILQDLSEAERRVFDKLCGKKVELQSAPKTISNQKTSLLKKLGLRNERELIHIFKN